jgi:hypothetical protein
MNWTAARPMTPGWYWFNHMGWKDVYLVKDFGNGELYAVRAGKFVSELDGQWAGPIEPPK